MGYDIKMYIGRTTMEIPILGNGKKKNPAYFNPYAMVDLAVVGNTAYNELQKLKDNSFLHAYFYAPNGNTKVMKDSYDDALKVIPFDKVLEILKKSNKKEKYRRFDMAIALMKAMVGKFSTDELGVVLFGH